MGSNAERTARTYWDDRYDEPIEVPSRMSKLIQRFKPKHHGRGGDWIVLATPCSLLALAGVICAVAGERVPHDVSDAKIPTTATELSNQPGQRKDGRTFSLEQRSGGEIDPILCASGTPPAILHDLGSSVVVFCKGDQIPRAGASHAITTEYVAAAICRPPYSVE